MHNIDNISSATRSLLMSLGNDSSSSPEHLHSHWSAITIIFPFLEAYVSGIIYSTQSFVSVLPQVAWQLWNLPIMLHMLEFDLFYAKLNFIARMFYSTYQLLDIIIQCNCNLHLPSYRWGLVIGIFYVPVQYSYPLDRLSHLFCSVSAILCSIPLFYSICVKFAVLFL
jgi:hypothetical protein